MSCLALVSLLLTFLTISRVTAHGLVTTPKPRQYGSAAQAVCGAAVYKVLTSDLSGPIENAVNKIDGAYDAEACPLYFCRGASNEDNTDNIRAYAAGDSVSFHVDIIAHHTGLAVDLASQTAIGSPLIDWPVYANDSIGPANWPKNETDFSVTIPDLEGRCAEAGACAIQWWWNAYSNDQTYESCVDFTQ
ncbi:hypothetical protein ACEPAI_2799 [Sanghuangporus weigelae]